MSQKIPGEILVILIFAAGPLEEYYRLMDAGQPSKQRLYLVGAIASVVVGGALAFLYRRPEPAPAEPDLAATSQADASANMSLRKERAGKEADAGRDENAPAGATASGSTAALSVSGSLSDDCLSLWSNLSVADLDHRRITAYELSSLSAPGDCRSSSPELSNALAAYARACAPMFADKPLDEREADDTKVVHDCAAAARLVRAWLGWQASDGKDPSEVSDPLLLVDRLLVLAGEAGNVPASRRTAPLKVDASRLSEIFAVSQRLLEIAETQAERELADEYYAASQPETQAPVAAAAPSGGQRAQTPISAANATGDQTPVVNSTYQNHSLTNTVLQQQKGLSPDALGLGHTVPQPAGTAKRP